VVEGVQDQAVIDYSRCLGPFEGDDKYDFAGDGGRGFFWRSMVWVMKMVYGVNDLNEYFAPGLATAGNNG
jgi:hypothetical protein